MKKILTTFQCFSAVTLLMLAAGCANPKQTELMLTAAGFKAIVPSTPSQEQQIKDLPADKLTVAKRNGKTFYVFPDPARHQIYVGSPAQYQAYQQILDENKILGQNRVEADMAGASGAGENSWAEWTEGAGWTSGTY